MIKSISLDCTEFVLHVKNEYDYLLRAENRQLLDEIINQIDDARLKLLDAQLTIYAVPDSPESHMTTKSKARAGSFDDPDDEYIIESPVKVRKADPTDMVRNPTFGAHVGSVYQTVKASDAIEPS